MIKLILVHNTKEYWAQAVGAIEAADCIYAEGWDSSTSVLDMTQNHKMWSIYPLSLLPGLLLHS